MLLISRCVPSFCADVLEAVEEAETQADLPDDTEQLREPQRKENVGNSTATGKKKKIFPDKYLPTGPKRLDCKTV